MRNAIALVIALTMTPAAMAKDVATVDGKGISESSFKKSALALGPRAKSMLANPKMRRQFLDHLIDSELLSKAAAKDKLENNPAFKERMEEAKRQILANLYTDQYIASKTTDKELKSYFDKNKGKFSKKEVKAAHILMKKENEKEAKKVLAEASKKGADFAALAKKHSTGPSAPRGGDLGFFGAGRMVPEFEKAAFATKKGQVHAKLVKTQFGFHIIKVTDIKGGDKVDFKTVKEEVKTSLERDLRTALTADLRKTHKVVVNEDALAKMKF